MIKLLEKRSYSPTMIARKLDADKRTVDKMIKVGVRMNIVGCKSVKINGRNYTDCGLTTDYRKMIKKELRR